jgi:hypothetical protein
MIASTGKRLFINHMVEASLLEPEPYQEAALDPSTRLHAALIVAITAFAAGLGSLGGGPTGFVLGFLAAVFGWGLFCYAAYWAATKHFAAPRTVASWGATWRTLALASSPRVFLILSFVPGIGLLIGLAIHAWVLITAVFALRMALDLEMRPAITTAAIGVLPMLVVWTLAVFLV